MERNSQHFCKTISMALRYVKLAKYPYQWSGHFYEFQVKLGQKCQLFLSVHPFQDFVSLLFCDFFCEEQDQRYSQQISCYCFVEVLDLPKKDGMKLMDPLSKPAKAYWSVASLLGYIQQLLMFQIMILNLIIIFSHRLFYSSFQIICKFLSPLSLIF